jgi:AAA+ superfamily predicted ATPase
MKIESAGGSAKESIRTTFSSINNYAGQSAQRGRGHLAITLSWIWICSLSVITVIAGIITAPTALMSGEFSSTLASWIGLIGATSCTGWLGFSARNDDNDQNPRNTIIIRLLDRATRTTLSTIDRLANFVASDGVTPKGRILLVGFVWLLTYFIIGVIMTIVLAPASLVIPIASPVIFGGFAGSTVLTAWIWRDARSRVSMQQHHPRDRGPRQQGSRPANSETGQPDEFVSDPPDMDFSDVVGMDDLKTELYDKVIDPLANPEVYAEYGLSVENGFLFYGPPGTGKTYISKCLAGELGVYYINAKAGDLTSKYVGEGATNIQQMFEEARANQPCLVFVDEIDALASDRSGRQTKSERQMVNQFLEELSEINDSDDEIIMLGATNLLETVDDAMLRTGRFSEKIEVPPPNPDARVALFNSHLEAPSDGLDTQKISRDTEGFVASDMENVAQRAARKAMRRARTDSGSESVTQNDVDEAISEVHAGRQAG